MVLGSALGACGKTTVRPEKAAETITNLVSRQTPFTPTDVKCPDGVEAKVGTTFDCHFTGPEGPYVAHMRILRVKGERVDFKIVTRPTG
jgi:hypothetical protein